MRTQKNESGQALIFVALSMAVLMGFMALAIDVGILFRARRNMQIAADAAATAAALNYLYYGSVPTAKAAAIAAAAANGVTITDNDINTPPSSGPNHSTTAGAYFEVLPNQATGTNFMGVISHTNSVMVGARAVAGTPTASQACIYITTPNAPDVFDLQGNAQIFAPGCGIYVNSIDKNAVGITGGSANVTAAFFDVNGPDPGGKSTTPTAPTYNSPAQSNPLGTILGPNPSTDCIAGNTVTVAIVATSTPLPSSNGITCFSTKNVGISGGVTLPGGVIYVFENGVSINGNITVGTTTSGATLDIATGLYDQGGNDITIHAPTTPGDPYNGIAIMEPPLMSAPNPPGNSTAMDVQFGSSTAIFDGIIYAPSAKVTLHDHGGGGLTATAIFAGSMFLKPSKTKITSITSYNSQHAATTPLRAVTMVE